ncbi:MAG: GatB/YqeY domain-containing protein, partial [Candidatus Dormiibacterota bacterium]
ALDATRLAELVNLVEAGTINRAQGLLVLAETRRSGASPAAIVEDRGLAQESDESALAAVVDAVVAEQEQAVADYRAGKQRAIGTLLAEVKRRTEGRANMKLASSLLRDRLAGS